MAVQIGTITLNDAWIRNKWGGRASASIIKKQATTQKINSLILPPCTAKSKEEKRSVLYAIDGTEYISNCNSAVESSPPTGSVSVHSSSPGSAQVGENIHIVVSMEGLIFRAIDIYGRLYRLTESDIITVRITDEYDRYVMKYVFCKEDGTEHYRGQISLAVQAEEESKDGSEKEVVINTCTSSQARALGLMLGTKTVIADEDVSFYALITEVNLEYVAQDMVDTATRVRQGVDIYKGTVRFVVL
jgi:hypothetical protein